MIGLQVRGEILKKSVMKIQVYGTNEGLEVIFINFKLTIPLNSRARRAFVFSLLLFFDFNIEETTIIVVIVYRSCLMVMVVKLIMKSQRCRFYSKSKLVVPFIFFFLPFMTRSGSEKRYGNAYGSGGNRKIKFPCGVPSWCFFSLNFSSFQLLLMIKINLINLINKAHDIP